MAAPTNPTANLLVQEAYKKVGIASPTTTVQGRAEDYFLNEIKHDIWNRAGASGNTRLKSLQQKSVQISVVGQSIYSFPSDFDEEISITILDGDHTGTATAGASTTITLAADEDAGVADVEGKYILITSGTGSTGLRQCVDYSTTTMIATVESAWTTNPDSTSVYKVVNQQTKLEEDNLLDENGLSSTFGKGKPSRFMKVFEGVNEKFYFDKPTDVATYGILTRYYTNLMELDTAEGSTIMSKLYLNWWGVLNAGLCWKIASDEDDDKWKIYKQEYEQGLANLLLKETPFGGEFQGFEI